MKDYTFNEVKADVALISQALAHGVLTSGAIVPRVGFNSAILHANVGAVDAGTLTSVTFQLWHGTEVGGGDMVIVPSTVLATSLLTVAAVDTDGKLDINLAAFNEYIMVKATGTLAGGGATVEASASFILGEAANLPVDNS